MKSAFGQPEISLRALVLPIGLLMLCFCYPLAQVALLSLHSPDFSLVEYRSVLGDLGYLNVGLRTLQTCLLVTAICLLLGYPTASYIATLPKRAARLALLCIAIPYLTSFLVRSYGWVVILGDEGLFNNALMAAGITTNGVEMLYTRFSTVLGMVHIMLPMMILPIYAAIVRMDKSLVRAARSLGGGSVRTFFAAYFPQTVNSVVSGCVLVFIVSSGFYITPAMLGGLSDVMLANLVAVQVTSLLNFPTGSALAIVLLIGAGVLLLGLAWTQRPKARGNSQQGDRGVRQYLTRGLGAISGYFHRVGLGRARGPVDFLGVLMTAIAILVCVYLVLPSAVVVIASFTGANSLQFPPESLSLRWYQVLFADAHWRDAARNSFQVALVTMLVATFLGFLGAYGASKLRGTTARKVVHGLFLAPLVVPSVVLAIAMFNVLAGWHLIGTREGLIIAHSIGSIPYVFVLVFAALLTLDPRLEMAAQSLGASGIRTMLTVILPTIAPAVISGSALAFIHSFDEVVITSFIAGVAIETLPLKMWVDIQNRVDPTIAAVSTLLILIPVVYLLISKGKITK